MLTYRECTRQLCSFSSTI